MVRLKTDEDGDDFLMVFVGQIDAKTPCLQRKSHGQRTRNGAGSNL